MNAKRQKKLMTVFLAGAMTLGAGISAQAEAAPAERETVTQVALLQSLAQGYFGGTITAGELRTMGDTGIGIPFSNVTFFDRDIAVDLQNVKDKAALEKALNEAVKEHGANSFYMVKIPAEFSSILFRSEYGSQKPYPTLVEALKDKQTEFTEKNIKGTIVGLYCPSYMGELNSVGWHFHFLSDDKKKGGHVLELSIKKGTAYLDQTDKFSMLLHEDKDFHKLNLAKDMRDDIRSAEQDTKGKLTGK